MWAGVSLPWRVSAACKPENLRYREPVGIVGGAIYRDVVAADVSGIGVHLLGCRRNEGGVAGLSDL